MKFSLSSISLFIIAISIVPILVDTTTLESKSASPHKKVEFGWNR